MEPTLHRGQGSITPTLFVGLGGTGSRIVDRIAQRAARQPNWESQLEPLTHFVSIDTNHLDQHALRFIPPGNRINIASFDKRKVVEHYRRSKEKQALQWIDPAYQPREGVKPGAGQIRIESRLGFFYHSPEIRAHFDRLVRDALQPGITWRQADPPRYHVYLFCTLAGGTGSGSFLSTAYLIKSVIEAQNWEPRIVGHLLLSTLMLGKVGPELHSDIHANTYAALKELEHLTKLGYPQVIREGRLSEEFAYWRDDNARQVQQVRTRPFFVSFVHDRPPHLDLPDVEAAVADGAYLQIFTPIIDQMAGELDNYEKNLEHLTRFPGELRDVGLGYTKNFGAFGAAAMVLPAEDLLEYSALRFTAQALRSQITFGVDREDPDDDRARALARLAVNYSDPKFLNMGDEGRERAINEAFVASVREMARQDANDELTEGYWYELVESADEGRVTGTDEKGEPVRGESRLDGVERLLTVERRELLNKVSIPKKSFVFPREGVNQYVELVSRLLEKIREARRIVDDGTRGLELAARDGEVVRGLKLDPIAERYLVLRLLERCETRWLPEAEQEVDKVSALDVENPRVRERLESENYAMLKDAAARRSLLRKDQAFFDARAEAEGGTHRVADAARRLLDARTRLRQLRALHEFLQGRARQYARLATRMESLVKDLESRAERMRRGELSLVPQIALRVELFQTLDEPRRRIWDRVYRRLYVDGGRFLATFDRQVLAETIARQLAPEVRADGSVVEKSLDKTVGDLRGALLTLGRERLRPSIFGAPGEGGLDMVSALELEGRLMLAADGRGLDDVPDKELARYREAKFRALAQLAGVMARVSSAEAKALDDGVTANRTRLLIVDPRIGKGSGEDDFVTQLESVLAFGGRQVKNADWPDPHLIVVHDVELAIPLYYLQAVVGEVEDAYLRLAAEENRSYHLHTDFHWEKSLPNLNPRRSEVTVGWSLRVLAEGLVTGVIKLQNNVWSWRLSDSDRLKQLDDNLAGALYAIGEIHRHEDLRQDLQGQLEAARRARTPEAENEKRQQVTAEIENLIRDMGLRELDAEIGREEVLDRPVLRALKRQLAEDWEPVSEMQNQPRYGNLGSE